MTKEEFILAVQDLGISLTEQQVSQLEKFYQLLISWNEKMNLTRITDVEDVYLKHYYDSLTLLKAVDLSQVSTLCDVGTGAGFPGIVLKIVFPNLKVTLVDSLQKRVTYLNTTIQELGLTDIVAYHVRGEDYAKEHREEFDVVVARAVSELRIIAEICIPMVKIGGHFIAMKGNVTEELLLGKRAVGVLSGRIEDLISFSLPNDAGNRTLVVVSKLKNTELKYPRPIDKIKKRAL